jgi:hypothetical protein
LLVRSISPFLCGFQVLIRHNFHFLEVKDSYAAYDRHRESEEFQRRAERIEYIKGLFGYLGSGLLSMFEPLTSPHDHTTYTRHISRDCNPGTRNGPRLEEVTSASAKSSHLAANSTMVNRRLGGGGGYSEP